MLNSVIVITGASSGLGYRLAELYAERGASIAIVARRAERLEQLAERIAELGGKALPIVADVSTEEACIDVVDRTTAAFGRIDVLINNAGRGNYSSVEDTSTEQWRNMFALNMDATFWLTREILPGMRQRNSGHIINISSVAGRMGFPLNAAYVAAKHAVVGFTAALRSELVGTNVHATVICPAGITTEWGAVTEGGSINDLYTKAIPRSRTIGKERGLPLAPLSKMMTADAVAQQIVAVIDHGRSNDVFTHAGTQELAVESVTDRMALEDKHLALWLAMQEIYHG